MLLAFALFLFLSSTPPQPDPVAYWDAVLVQYEKLGQASLNNESPKEINKLKKTLEEMLKSPVGKMNEEQYKRFQEIKARHAGMDSIQYLPGRVDTLVIIQQVPVEKVREIEHIVVTDTVTHFESIGKIQMEHIISHKDTTVIMHVLQNIDADKAKERSKTPAVNDFIFFAGLTGGFYPDLSGGATVGVGNSKIGGYIKGRSNLNRISPEYHFEPSGEISPGQYFWGDGTSSVSRIALTAGAYFAVVGNLSGYAGVGWGKNTRYYRDISGYWAELNDTKSSGVSFDFGIGYNPGRFRLFAGVNCTSFSYIDFEIGVAFDIIEH